MATPEHVKRKKMDAISHPETQKQLRLLRGNLPPPLPVARPNPILPNSGGLIPKEVKRLAMSAISSVETLSQVGMIRKAGAIAVYVGRISEVDRETPRQAPHGRSVRRPLPPGRDLGRD